MIVNHNVNHRVIFHHSINCTCMRSRPVLCLNTVMKCGHSKIRNTFKCYLSRSLPSATLGNFNVQQATEIKWQAILYYNMMLNRRHISGIRAKSQHATVHLHQTAKGLFHTTKGECGHLGGGGGSR